MTTGIIRFVQIAADSQGNLFGLDGLGEVWVRASGGEWKRVPMPREEPSGAAGA